MTDLRTLLHDAAPRPTAALDVDAVLVTAAGRRRPWRRIGMWFGGVAVAAGLTGGAVGVLSPASSTDVDTAPAPSERREVAQPSGEVDDRVTFEAASSTHETSTTTTAARTAATSGDEEWDELGAPPAEDGEGCHVVAGGTGWASPTPPIAGGAGNDDMSADRCGYVARERGGYRGSGTWSVTIERDGERITFAHLDSPECADDVIRPGDIVTVSVRTAGATAEGEIHAGPDVGCE